MTRPRENGENDRRMARAALLRAAQVVFAAAALVLVIRGVAWSDVEQALRGTKRTDAGVALAVSVLVQILASWRWRIVLGTRGFPISASDALRVHFGALFAALFLPAGNVAALLLKFVRVPGAAGQRPRVVEALLVDRLWATVALAIVGLAGLFAAREALVPRSADGIPANPPVFPAFVFVVIGTAAAITWTHRNRRSPWSTESVRPLALSLASHALGVVSFVILARSNGLDVDAASLTWIRSATVLATMIPLTWMGVGLREGALLTLLQPRGVESAQAIAFGFLVFIVTVLGPALLGGIIELIGWGTRRASRRDVS